jgi:peroxiredoxin
MPDKKQDWVFTPKNMGERLPRIVLQDERFKSFDLNHLIGKPVVIFYLLSIHHPFCLELINIVQRKITEFREKGVSVIGITPNSATDLYDCARKLNILFPLLSDSEFQAAKALGIVLTANAGPKEAIEVRRSTFILDSTLRIRKQFSPKETNAHVLQVLSQLSEVLPENQPHLVKSHAPVLLIPNVIEPGLCHEIATQRELEQPFSSYVDKRLYERVVPEILKAFYFKPKKRKVPIISVYTPNNKGPSQMFRVHALEHEAPYQYVIVIALSSPDEYKGGGICFPEYGLGIYKPQLGEAMVYSTFLLQEILPVTFGQAVMLTSYFYDEESDVFGKTKHQLNTGVSNKPQSSNPNDPIF